MFDHVKFGVSDCAASKAFFLKALEPLGVAFVQEGPPAYGVELSPKGKASLCLYQTEEKPAHLHLWFATNPRPNPSIEGTSPSGLRPLTARPRFCLTYSFLRNFWARISPPESRSTSAVFSGKLPLWRQK
jgi:hypothetical protein